jgi:putative ABC transport system substrate-binding protein
MRRREFITLLGGAAAAWPLAAGAQQPTIPVIGFLSGASPELWAARLRAFRQGLSEAGFVEGRNVMIEYRWAEDHNDRLPALVADLVRRQVTVIVTSGPAVGQAKAATATIPIVFQAGFDPVERGLVASLNRPGGNLTGFSMLDQELEPKRLELLHELVPAAGHFAVLLNPTSGDPVQAQNQAAQLSKLQAAARTLGLQLEALHAGTERDLDTAIANLVQQRIGGLVISDGIFLNARSEQLGALSSRHAVPTIFQFHEFAAAGGLMSYGINLAELHRQTGIYTGRILRGEKPADLPVQQSTKVELILNLKTAKALGLTVPQLLLGRADEIIE